MGKRGDHTGAVAVLENGTTVHVRLANIERAHLKNTVEKSPTHGIGDGVTVENFPTVHVGLAD